MDHGVSRSHVLRTIDRTPSLHAFHLLAASVNGIESYQYHYVQDVSPFRRRWLDKQMKKGNELRASRTPRSHAG
jgi:hypothetical protein